MVLCPCGFDTVVPESWKQRWQPAPYHLHTLLGTLVVYVEPHRDSPSPHVPTSLIHWNLLLPCPCIPTHWCQNNNKTPKIKTTAPHSTDFNTISPWNSFLNTKERVYVKYCCRAHFSYSFPCKCFCTLSAKDLAGTQCEALPNEQSVTFQMLFTNEFSITMFGTIYCSALDNLLCGPAVLTHNGWLKVYN